ncbi:MAG: hypothetical protein OXT09_12680, partial [Myxococcales bacterium]|nr:hypothetical protein [Myxococcales bacterium]
MRVPRLVVLMVVLGACAEGVTVGPEASTRLPISEAPASAEVPMAGSVADEEPVEPMMPMTTAYTGESCVMNEPVTCICEDTGTEGQRRCLFDPNSPTQGTLSDTCERCAPPAEPEAEEPEAPSDTPDASGSEPD